MNWLLLRGLVRERRHWSTFPDQLAARTGGVVLCLDLPGVGTERGRPSPTSLGEIVQDLRARFVTDRGDATPWSLFAPSLGGMIALTWAEAHPEDFAGVAVCNTSTRDLGGLFDRFSPEALRTVLTSLGAMVFAPDVYAREARILALVSNTDQGRAHAQAFTDYALEAPIGPNVLVRQLWAASRARAPQSLAVPLHVLCSEGDRLCHPKVSRALAARLGARLSVHPTAGHDLPLDDTEWVINALAGC